MAITLTGNVGGTGASGARVQIISSNGAENYGVNADSNGDYTVNVNGYASYTISAGGLTNKIYRGRISVNVLGASISALNLSYNAVNDPSNYT